MIIHNFVNGLDIISNYDQDYVLEHTEGIIGNFMLATVADTKSNFSDEDVDKLFSLGWEYEDREVWMFNLDQVEDSQ